MKILQRFVLGVTLVLLSFSLNAQVVIKGQVMDETSSEELIGASLIIEGTGSGTVTDYDGSYELKIKEALPVNIIVSYVGYEDKTIVITEGGDLDIKMSSGAITTVTAVVKTQRISDKQKAAPLTVESLDAVAIKETTSDNFYDGLGNLKGVDLTAASLGFKVINTRGFNSTSPVRSLQIIDGVDNQAPGLNFSLGNFLGSPELDVRKVDIIQGASSAFYGPNAFNGVISMETKDPFYTEGLSAQVKLGERNMLNPEIRWADSFTNKDGFKNIAYKFTFSYLSADDWEANNYDAVDGSNTPANNAGGYDAVNRYGDEYFTYGDLTGATSNYFNDNAGLITIHRKGYDEKDLVDYDTRNFKGIGSVSIRTNPKMEAESPELVLGMSYGAGTTVYQGDNRFSLKNIQFVQPKFEFRKRDNFFLRGYMSQENAGNSYDPYFTALRLQEESQTNGSYVNRYTKWWADNGIADLMRENGYPMENIIFDPVTGTVVVEFDYDAADQWILDNAGFMQEQHDLAAAAAGSPDPVNDLVGRLDPGTPGFQTEFDRITTTYNNEEGGTRFYGRSALYHLHGEKKIKTDFAEIRLGGNGRLYRPDTRGTVFSDTTSEKIKTYEFGFYGGIDKVFQDGKYRASITARADKNKNFDWLFTPAASLVWKPRANHYVRGSFSAGVRNPTLSDQYLSLDVGPATLSGNLTGVDSLITVESFIDFISGLPNADKLVYYNIDAIRPERVKTFEIGYRGSFNKLYVDANYYYSIYNDFIGYNIGLDVEFGTGPLSFIPENVDVFRYASNAQDVVTTQGFSIGLNYYFANYFQVNGNYSFNALVSQSDDPIIPAFNTPKNKFNIGISGRKIQWNKLKNFGFNFNYKWVEGFVFEGSPQFTGLVPSYGLLNGQINYFVPKWNTTIKLGATNILNNLAFQTYGGPRIGRLAYVSVLYEWANKK